jgi:hypothetical protein
MPLAMVSIVCQFRLGINISLHTRMLYIRCVYPYSVYVGTSRASLCMYTRYRRRIECNRLVMTRMLYTSIILSACVGPAFHARAQIAPFANGFDSYNKLAVPCGFAIGTEL